MTKSITIVLLIMLGLIARPVQSFALLFGAETTSCCEKESSMSCCEQDDKDEKKQGCDGDCNCANCECTGHLSSTTLLVFKSNTILIPFIEKEPVFLFLNNFVSSDLGPIWLPPKIS